ncbi:MAG: glutaconate CoA-transferase [Chloroflexi bacterium RBG_16_57_8]|nr:MAG: glutaconate CoA-transferase [Chloroflexi bacterium RBG_16_57_8]
MATYLKDGDYLAVGGFGTNRIPTALLHEVVRQRRQNLALSGHTATHDFQILAAGKCINRCDAAYIVGLEARGLSPNARMQCQNGDIELVEWTNYSLALRYRAAAMGIPYIPARVMLGTDTYNECVCETVACPYTGKKLLAVPALHPDVAFIHVHRADARGSCQIDGITVSDVDIACAAKRVVVSCEEIVEEDVIRGDPSRTAIPWFCVDAVVHVPYGSYPGNMPYLYFSDEEHLREWLAAEADEDEFQKFLEQNIYGTSDFDEYLGRRGGAKRLGELEEIEHMRGRVNG